ncbi:MAG TPA: hypothetical protein PKL84_09420, partial [Candidatus Hydrogenedentes bacterium]|nr:hypothetical protein [Candidatus Hydrogenedentota bacterium]
MKKDLLFIILGLTIVSSITLPVGWYLGSLIEEEGNGEKARETVLPAEKPSSAELAMVESAADMSPTTPAGGNAETPGTHDSVKEQEVALAARHGTEEGRGSVYKAQEGAASTQAAVPGAQGGAASEQSAASPQSAGVPANGQLADNAILTLSAVFIGGGVAGCI